MNENKTKLSKSILEMKFMKKTKEKVENQLFQQEGEDYFGNQWTKRLKTESKQFIIEPSYVFCEQLIEGRLSFQGMNPDIEKLMELDEKKKQMKLETKNETDVSDQQMANYWNKNRKIGRKFQDSSSNRTQMGIEPVRKKMKFLKPQD